MLTGFTGCKGTHYFFNKVYKLEKILSMPVMERVLADVIPKRVS